MDAVVEEARAAGCKDPARLAVIAIGNYVWQSQDWPEFIDRANELAQRARGQALAPLGMTWRKAVTDALVDSVDVDELKGDYAAAATAAAAALDAARAGADPAARADAAIWAGIVAALRSEPAAATAFLEEALAAVPDHPLGTALRRFAAGAERRLPDGYSREVELSDLWIEPRSGDPVEAELYVLTRVPALRSSLQNSVAVAPESIEVFLADALGTLEAIWDRRPYARRAAAEVAWIAGSPELAQQHLAAAVAAYSAAGDDAGVASCQLARGPPAGRVGGQPADVRLRAVGEPRHEHQRAGGAVDRTLAPVPDAAASAAAYQRAEDAFRAAGAPRGLAMVDLHRAAVAALHDDPAAALARRRARAGRLRAAGDLAAAHLAAAHAALAGVHAGAWPERGDVAAQIGAWGRESGAFAWALGIGMMFSQAGWRWLRRDADPDRALACHRLADAAVHGARRARPSQQTLGDRALAHDAGGNWEAALVAGGAAWRVLPESRRSTPSGRRSWGCARATWRTSSARWRTRARRGPRRRARPRARAVARALRGVARGEGRWRTCQRTCATSLMQRGRGAGARDGERPRVGRGHGARLSRARRCAEEPARVHRAAPPGRARRRGGGARRTPRPARGASCCSSWATGPRRLKALRDRPPPERVPPDPVELATDAVLSIRLEDWPEARSRHAALEQLAGRPDWWAQESRPWRLPRRPRPHRRGPRRARARARALRRRARRGSRPSARG